MNTENDPHKKEGVDRLLKDSDVTSVSIARGVALEVKSVEKITGAKKLEDIFQGKTELQFDLKQGRPLQSVIQFFGSIIDDFDLQDSLFFTEQGAEARQDFLNRFLEFKTRVHAALRRFVSHKRKNGIYSNFSAGWMNRQIEAAYFAFFLHYGEKRKYDLDQHGQPKDYVEHLFDSVFNRLFDQMNFPHELAALALWCHDTRENCTRGLLAVLYAKDIENLQRAIRGRAKKMDNFEVEIERKTERMYDHLDRMYRLLEPPIYRKIFNIEYFDKTDKSSPSILAYLVNGVSKELGQERLAGLVKLCACLTDDVNGNIFIDENSGIDYRWLLLIVKFADRLSNATDYKTGLQKKPHKDKGFADMKRKVKALEDETVLIYIILADILDMDKVADMLRAYVLEKDPKVDRQDSSHIHRLFFQNEISAQKILRELADLIDKIGASGLDTNMEICISKYKERAALSSDMTIRGRDIIEDTEDVEAIVELGTFLLLADHYFDEKYEESQPDFNGREIGNLEFNLRRFAFYKNLILDKNSTPQACKKE